MALRGGRYELLGTIASGGMATVHLGRALGAGGFERLVAIKTMHPHLAKEPEFVAMFLDEARLAARIRHPNVVATLDIQQDAEGLFLVMEYVEGPSLSRLIKALTGRGRASRTTEATSEQRPPAEQRLPLEVALRIFLDTLAGLHAAHELTGPDGEPLRLIHRDMSPHNVLVGSDGIARLTDFGVARAESRLANTRTGSIKGKVMYMAPEQIRSQGVDRRADIYAAGAVLWEILTGDRIVRADSDLAAMRQIVDCDRQPPHEVDPSVPEAISMACIHALARDRELRYPTAAAFAEALERAAAACGVTIATPRTVAQLVRALGVHKPVESVPPSASQPSLPGPLSPVSSSGAPAVQAGTRVDATPPSVGTHAAFATQPLVKTGRGRLPIIVAATSAAVLGAAVALLLTAGGGAPSGDAPVTAAPLQEVTSASASPAVVPAPSRLDDGAPGRLTAPAAPDPGAEPSTSATAAVQGSAAPSAVASSAPTPTPPVVRPAEPRPVKTANPKGFRPKEL